MRTPISPLTPARVYRYAVQVCQPSLQFRDAKTVAGQTILTVLFAAAARISSLSDTCRLLRDVPDEHAVATALYATLPEYNTLRRRVQAAWHGHLPKALRRRPQGLALDLTLLPDSGADRRTNPHVVRSKAKKGTCSFSGYGTASVVRNGQRWVQPVWVQLSRERKSMRGREKAHAPGAVSCPAACARGHDSPPAAERGCSGDLS